ncbi:hypothetical protein B0H21DRAFT_820376 [Amylocystis lapponica]|nr:hypothetical protein B0H21DRAFT_820376 [Amylocystis lapponica]
MPESKIPVPADFRGTKFSLDVSGVSGFFGGDVAVTAMATVYFYKGRKWLGWYNSPGSYDIGRRYGQLATSRFWDGIFPGPNMDPATLFGLDGRVGPRFVALFSGTVMEQTGHCAALFMRACEELRGVEAEGRATRRMSVTIAELRNEPAATLRPSVHDRWASLLACFPILSSVATCVLCGLVQDWYCFAMILLGIATSGVSCYVIGCGELTFTHPNPAVGAPRGDGVLVSENSIVILRGGEGAINSVTRGRFLLDYSRKPCDSSKFHDRIAGHDSDEPRYWSIGICALFLTVQFLAQLLLIPQGTLFGQLMFITSLGVSWLYNMYLSSLDGESMQCDILLKEVLRLGDADVKKYSLGTRTSATVFALLASAPDSPGERTASDKLHKRMNELLPNDTRVWKTWKEMVVRRIREDIDRGFDDLAWDEGAFNPDERRLLRELLGDARSAHKAYLQKDDANRTATGANESADSQTVEKSSLSENIRNKASILVSRCSSRDTLVPVGPDTSNIV